MRNVRSSEEVLEPANHGGFCFARGHSCVHGSAANLSESRELVKRGEAGGARVLCLGTLQLPADLWMVRPVASFSLSMSQSSTQGLVRELIKRGEAAGARVLCPVPFVAEPLQQPPVVPR